MKARRALVIALCAAAVVAVAAALYVSPLWPTSAGTRVSPSAAPSSAIPESPSPAPTPVDGTEVLPPSATPAQRLPPSSPKPGDPGLTPLISLPLPASASAERAVVDGFPVELIQVAPGSQLTSTSIATEGNRMQAGLVGRTTASPASVLDFYRAAFVALGFADSGSAANSDSASFSRGPNAVTVAVTAGGTGWTYSVFGALTAE